MSTITIVINKITDNAMASSAGDKLREKMEKEFERDENTIIILDFSKIELYATPFFNRSTGYFYLKFANENIYNEKIKLINLDSLGQETYEYSLSTAKILLNKRISEQLLDEILNSDTEN